MKRGAQAQRRVLCPTCRTRTLVADIAYVDAGRGRAVDSTDSSGGAGAAADAGVAAREAAEERIVVCGSYGTKVRCLPNSHLSTTVAAQEALWLVGRRRSGSTNTMVRLRPSSKVISV